MALFHQDADIAPEDRARNADIVSEGRARNADIVSEGRERDLEEFRNKTIKRKYSYLFLVGAGKGLLILVTKIFRFYGLRNSVARPVAEYLDPSPIFSEIFVPLLKYYPPT